MNSRVIDRPVLVFFIGLLLVGILAHYSISTGGSEVFIEHYGFDTGRIFYFDSAAVSFTIFWAATLLLYITFKDLFHNGKWALMPVILLYLSPAVLGKIINFNLYQYFLSFLILNIFLTKKFCEGPNVAYGFALSAVQILLILIYPCMGVLIPITVLFFTLNIFTRNLVPKKAVFLLPYLGSFLSLFTLHFIFRFPVWFDLPTYRVSAHSYGLWWYFRYLINTTPPLFFCYFVFSLVSLNVFYFTNYFHFLKYKWIYTYAFVLPVVLYVAERFILPASYGMYYSLLVMALSMVIIAVAGCFEFASWVRKRWGDKIYFIFKVVFFSFLALQSLVCIVVIIYLYPDYELYRNWPLFFW